MSFFLFEQVMLVKIMVDRGILQLVNANAGQQLDFLVHLAMSHADMFAEYALFWFRLDHLLYDITIVEESTSLLFKQAQNLRLDSWDDHKSRHFTGFSSTHLLDLYDQFDIAALADPLDGFVKVSTGQVNAAGRDCCYNLHPEELFLFFMTRMKKGFSILDMVSGIFGGYPYRWHHGFRFILCHLDARYENVIGHQCLARYVNQFEDFYRAIERKVTRPKTVVEQDGTTWTSPGLSCLPIPIFAFIDNSCYETCVPFSGPDGDSSRRRPNADLAQNSVYTGYIHMHGLKVETLYLPNGLSTLFGPVSIRHPDTGVLNLSNINLWLRGLQQGVNNPPYSALGDLIYRVNLDCIRTYYRAYFSPAEMTEFMRYCDAELRSCRQHIELGYGKTANLFKICDHYSNMKLAQSNPYAVELLRMSHLLTNIYNILNGSSAAGCDQFDIEPPSLAEYLSV